MIKQNFRARFFAYAKHEIDVTIIGVGSVGSNVAKIAASMMVRSISIVDPDSVETENLCVSAFYNTTHIGMPKVHALRNEILDMTGNHVPVFADEAKYEAMHVAGSDIVVAAVDSMSVRNDIYRDWLSCSAEWLVDFRMAGKFASAFFVRKGEDHTYYTLKSDPNDSYANMPCGQQAHPAVTCGWIPFIFGSFLSHVISGDEWLHREIHGGAWIGMEVDGNATCVY